MRTLIIAVATVVIAASAARAGAQEPAATVKPALQAFEHYEGVRVALSSDSFSDVAAPAKRLVHTADAAGGAKAKQAAEQLAAAKDIEEARTHFGELSTILVPVFQKEGIPGTHAFMCDMKNKPWMQRGEKIENPYYGKSMLTCGSAITKNK
jgi:hypothetical protein